MLILVVDALKRVWYVRDYPRSTNASNITGEHIKNLYKATGSAFRTMMLSSHFLPFPPHLAPYISQPPMLNGYIPRTIPILHPSARPNRPINRLRMAQNPPPPGDILVQAPPLDNHQHDHQIYPSHRSSPTPLRKDLPRTLPALHQTPRICSEASRMVGQLHPRDAAIEILPSYRGRVHDESGGLG